MWKQAVFIVLLAALGYRIFRLAVLFGVFENTYNHAPGPCRRLAGIEHGSEDIEVLKNGLAFISSGLQLTLGNPHRTSSVGRIFLFDFNKPDVDPRSLGIDWNGDTRSINPHGISLWTNSAGMVYLYVISHHCPGEVVDKFLFQEQTRTLKHLRRIENEENFHIINDLKIVEEDKFYYTNYLYLNDKLESALSLYWGSVGYFDGKHAAILEKGFLMPNGINLSPDRRYLYLSHIGDQEVRIYKRQLDNNITFLESAKVWTNLDNLDVDIETGDVWIGAHPVGYRVMQYMENPDNMLSPSQVLKLRIADGHVQDITEVYANNGEELSGSTVAVKHKNSFLVGTITTHCLYCQINV